MSRVHPMSLINMIKGVVLAGGSGTRLRPITKIMSKHLLPVGTEPLIYYPIKTLRNAGIKDILMVCGAEHTDQYLKILGSGRELGVRLSYTIQQKPVGIAQGLGLARSFAEGNKVALILGDNLFGDNFRDAITAFKKKKQGAMVVIKEVKDPHRFGVVKFNGSNIQQVIEKPKRPPTNWAVTGLYLYDNRVFDVIKNLKPSARGEYEITDVNNHYINEGTMDFVKAKKFWLDAGTFESLHQANLLVRKHQK